MWSDVIWNGQGHGAVAEALQDCRFDPGLMRPWIDEDNRKVCTINTNRKKLIYDPRDKDLPVNNRRQIEVPVYETVRIKDLQDEGIDSPVFNAATLRFRQWIEFDRVLIEETRRRLRAWQDLAAANTYTLDGMSRTVLEHENINDPGIAMVDMEALSEGRNDSPLYGRQGLPLPITHSDFFFSERRLRISRNGGQGLDTTMLANAARRVAEMVERTTIGVMTGLSLGTDSAYANNTTVYGYLNYPDRITKTDLTVPNGSNAEATVQDVLEMRESMYDLNYYGPFILYMSTDWDKWLDNDYKITGGNNPNTTLRKRLLEIEGIAAIRRLDYLTASTNPYTMIMVQMTPEIARAVIGMPLQTIQWESKGGWRKNFKVMCIYVAQLRSTQSGNTGILHATTS